MGVMAEADRSAKIQQLRDAALEHYRARRLPQAEAACRQLLALKPNDPDGLELAGMLAHHSGDSDAAIELIRRAISLNSLNARYFNDLGLVLDTRGRADEAISAFQQAISLQSDYVEALNNLGTCLRRKGKLKEAIDAYRRAVACAANFSVGHYNLANALREQRMLDDAITSYRRAIELQPDFAAAYSNLGVAYKDAAQIAESLEVTRRALEIKPDLIAASNSLCTMHYWENCDPMQLFREHEGWNQSYGKRFAAEIRPHPNDRSPTRRLRIGYISPDLSSHPVGRCFLPVLAHHDRENFQIICYSDARQPDAITRRSQSHADLWHTTAQMSDQQLAQLVREDQIDILVDMAAHTNENRMPVFARKPAPLQVTWLGLPTTTGLDTMDYRLSDPYLDPPNSKWPYTEKTLRLPHCFWPYQPLDDQPAVNDLPASRNGYITFGCFNSFCKINNRTIDLWAQVLSRVKGSRLLLLAPAGSARERIILRLGMAGLAPHRSDFIDRLPHPRYLELYHQTDVILDTVPFGGHTTTIDAFWMGVPVVSLAGELPVWRAGLSIASNVGLAELAAEAPEEYVKKAVELAASTARLPELRQGLRSRLQASPIMNIPQFAADLEKIFRAIWIDWCAGHSA